MNNWGYHFSQVEYLTIFNTFIYGYIATQFFSGWGFMISHWKKLIFSKEHFAWTLLVFVLLIDVWWGSWLKGLYIVKSSGLFYLNILPPLLFFFIAVTLFPPKKGFQNIDLRVLFLSVRKKIYFLFICLHLAFLLTDSFLLKSSLLVDYVANIGAICLAFAGLYLEKRWMDRFIISVGWILLIVHFFNFKSLVLMQPNINGFSLTEYLTIFIAFIYGAVVSRFFVGWGYIFNSWKEIKVSNKYLIWTFMGFGLVMNMWWGSWDRVPYITNSIWGFLMSLSIPMTLYLLSAVIFPDSIDKEKNFDCFYERNIRLIVAIFAAILIVNSLVALMIEEVQLITFENLLRVIGITFTIACVFLNRPKYYDVVLALGWLLLILDALFSKLVLQ